MELVHALDRQRPLHHLLVGGVRQIDPSHRRGLVEVLGGEHRPHPPLRLRLGDSGEERLQPLLLEDPVVRVRPEAELLSVIAVGRGRAAVVLCQVVDDLLRRGEWDPVAEPLVDGEDGRRVPGLLGDVIAGNPILRHASGAEVGVVEERVADAGLREDPRQIGIPDALGQPHALRPCPEVPLAEHGHHLELTDRVMIGEHREDGLVEAAAQDLDLSPLDQRAEALEVRGPVLLDPLEQRTREVQADLHRLEPLDQIRDRPIAALVGVREDVLEVADGLVIVEDEEERPGGHDAAGPSYMSRPSV